MVSWQLQDAKARLSELIRSLRDTGPQAITVHGRPTAVVLSPDDYARLTAGRPGFVDFVRQSPLAGAGVAVRRDPSGTRPTRL
jgi:prevent-host-death family protein